VPVGEGAADDRDGLRARLVSVRELAAVDDADPRGGEIAVARDAEVRLGDFVGRRRGPIRKRDVLRGEKSAQRQQRHDARGTNAADRIEADTQRIVQRVDGFGLRVPRRRQRELQ
jgi:hypothetical protein